MDVTQDTGVSVVTTIIFVIFALEWILNSIVRDTYRFGFAWYASSVFACVYVCLYVCVCVWLCVRVREFVQTAVCTLCFTIFVHVSSDGASPAHSVFSLSMRTCVMMRLVCMAGRQAA